MIATCFVIQPFDSGEFDRRFDEVVAPAIKAAGLEPYRVDRDTSVSIPIDEIQSGIDTAAACVADISTDNPNVWFEVGYAIAKQKEIVLVCSAARERFPFDVQHRAIVRYRQGSPSDFQHLGETIRDRLKAGLNARSSLRALGSVTRTSTLEGLSPHEVACLVSVATRCIGSSDMVSPHTILEDMQRAGFTGIAGALAVRSLIDQHLISETESTDSYSHEPFTLLKCNSRGFQWLKENQSSLALRATGRSVPHDGIPF